MNGRLGNLDLVYTGGFLQRDVDSIIDYTFYNNGGGYITYYLCSGNVYDATDVNNCYNPTKQYLDNNKNERTTHELRITSPGDERFRYIAGVYFNDVETNHAGEFQYFSTNSAFSEHISSYYNDNSGDGFLVGNTTVPTAGVTTSGPRSPQTTFFNDFTRTEEEIAFFGQLAFDITDSLTMSVSARVYDLDTQLQGASNFSFGCRYGIDPQGFGNSERTEDGRCNSHAFSNDVTERLLTLGQYGATGDDNLILDARAPNGVRDLWRLNTANANDLILQSINDGSLDISNIEPDGSTNESDTIFRASIDYRPNDDSMVFAAYSEGYRPATQNRNAGKLASNQTGVYQGYHVPTVAVTDTLENVEFGYKGDIGNVRLNATYYHSEIADLQMSRFDPSNVAFLVFIENVGDAEIDGLDVDFQWAATDNFTLMGAFSWLDTELTRLNSQLDGVAVPVGSELPLAPELSGNLRGRYDFYLDGMQADAYITASVNFRGESVSALAGSAEFFEDTLFLQTGTTSGLKIRDEGGTFGTVMISDGAGGTRLPINSRYVNPSATTVNFAVGMNKDNWGAELFVDNVGNEEAPIVQVAGKFTPEMTVQRPMTIGIRFNMDYE